MRTHQSSSPILGFDHILLKVSDLSKAKDDHHSLFGTAPAWEGTLDGSAACLFEFQNTAFVLAQSETSEGLGSICFQVDDIKRMSRRLSRLQMPEAGLETIIPPSEAADSTKTRVARSIDPEVTNAIPLSFTTYHGAQISLRQQDVTGIDHVVIATTNPDRGAALFGARLGLDMRVNLKRPDWGAHLMFFKCGDAVIELVHRLGEGDTSTDSSPDTFYGLSWRVKDATLTHARLSRAGFDLTEVKDGRRPGTKIFSVLNRTAGVPTVVLQLPNEEN
jgi:catechol 2,3-dioxygenase-like lactoylglutathione lyase family enzyme